MLNKLEHCICKFPTEWDAETLEERWKWLKDPKKAGDYPLGDDDFKAFLAHGNALCFWKEAKEEAKKKGANLPDNPWRFHPRRFLQVFRTFCIWPDLILRWRIAEASRCLPKDEDLSLFGKTALYEFGFRSSLAATRNHKGVEDYAAFRSLDQRHAVIFGMRVHTEIDAMKGKGKWDDRVILLKRDETGLVENIYRGAYATEPSGRYLDGGENLVENKEEGKNAGGTDHIDIGRLIADRTYEYQPYQRNNLIKYGPSRFGGNQFNILRKTKASQVERLVTNNATLGRDEYVSEENTHWETGENALYSEEQSMHFHKGYAGYTTGSAGCQTFPYSGGDTFEDFMRKLEPMSGASRFQYVLKNL